MKKLVWIVLCLLYVLSWIDLIPDVFFPFGFIDDAAVVVFTVRKLLED